MTTKIIAVINQKGGVGKTTTSANLAHALALKGMKVTLIDFDPQGHLGVSFGEINHGEGIGEVLLGNSRLDEAIVMVRENLQLIPAGSALKEIEQLTEGGAQRGDLLRKVLETSLQDQDFVLIDCPPSSGLLAANALFATEELLIPMSGDFLSLQGLSHLMGSVRKFEKVLNKKYTKWLVLSRFNSVRRLSKQVLNILLKHFPQQILATVIRENAMLAECPSYGKTVLEYRPSSRSARDFRSLADDFLERKVMNGA